MAVKITGMNVKVQQGDMKDKISCFGSAVVDGDYEPIKDILNASAEFAVIGYNLKKAISPAPVVTAGTAGVKLVSGTLIIEREGAKTLYVKMMLPEDDVKAKAVGTALLGKTYGGAAITKVTKKSAGTTLAQ